MTQKPEIINIEALDTARNLLGERFSVIIKYFLEDNKRKMQYYSKQSRLNTIGGGPLCCMQYLRELKRMQQSCRGINKENRKIINK